ncbi:hypothetical protein SUGI_0446370 [Cryptomeria japonica]|nr:hypothetical protein SUGI_0446370 [Cryptomeria japonica]
MKFSFFLHPRYISHNSFGSYHLFIFPESDKSLFIFYLVFLEQPAKKHGWTYYGANCCLGAFWGLWKLYRWHLSTKLNLFFQALGGTTLLAALVLLGG